MKIALQQLSSDFIEHFDSFSVNMRSGATDCWKKEGELENVSTEKEVNDRRGKKDQQTVECHICFQDTLS